MSDLTVRPAARGHSYLSLPNKPRLRGKEDYIDDKLPSEERDLGLRMYDVGFE